MDTYIVNHRPNTKNTTSPDSNGGKNGKLILARSQWLWGRHRGTTISHSSLMDSWFNC